MSKKIGLELGGKSPNIIFADTDIEAAVEWAMIGIFFNQGEVCCAGSRIIIESSIKDAFVKRFAERANNMTLGNPLNNPDMGPLVSKKHMADVLKYIEEGKAEGATLCCGGYRYTEGECAKGYFVRPTIFDNCTSDMKIVQEEIFGPVVTIQTFDTEEDSHCNRKRHSLWSCRRSIYKRRCTGTACNQRTPCRHHMDKLLQSGIL